MTVCTRFLLLAGVVLALAGCPEGKEKAVDDDLPKAEKALAAQNIPDAEMFFERYLRTHPDGADRWQVWTRLLDIALNHRQEKSMARNYLEIMLKEYADQGEKRRGIQMSLAALCREMLNYPRAISLWEALAKDPELSAEDKAEVYRQLGRAYMRRLDFTLAANILQACLDSKVAASIKADCMYDMADQQALTDNMPKAVTTLRALLKMPEASPQRRVLATFMLADALDSLDKSVEAKELFESIRDTYPNEKVIELRIQFLNKKLKQ